MQRIGCRADLRQNSADYSSSTCSDHTLPVDSSTHAYDSLIALGHAQRIP